MAQSFRFFFSYHLSEHLCPTYIIVDVTVTTLMFPLQDIHQEYEITTEVISLCNLQRL